MQVFAHDSSNDSHFTQAFGTQALGKGTQDRIVVCSSNGRHLQDGTNGAVATFGEESFLFDGVAGLVMRGVQAISRIIAIQERSHAGYSVHQLW